MKTIKCKCGFDSGYKTPARGYNVGEVAEGSGMIFVFLSDGDSTWICPGCNDVVQKAAKVIVDRIGSRYVHFSSLLRKPKK